MYAWVMCIKSDDVGYAHIHKFLKCKRAVERFALCSLMLSAFVQKRHNNADSFCFSCSGRDDSLQILIMVVRRHVVFVAAYFIGETVIADINENIQVGAADRIIDMSFSFSGAESRAVAVE